MCARYMRRYCQRNQRKQIHRYRLLRGKTGQAVRFYSIPSLYLNKRKEWTVHTLTPQNRETLYSKQDGRDSPIIKWLDNLQVQTVFILKEIGMHHTRCKGKYINICQFSYDKRRSKNLSKGRNYWDSRAKEQWTKQARRILPFKKS